MENLPEKALWEPLAFTLLRMRGRATLAEVEPMREATLGANMRVAAIVEERVRRVEMIGRKQRPGENEGRMEVKQKVCWNLRISERQKERMGARGKFFLESEDSKLTAFGFSFRYRLL